MKRIAWSYTDIRDLSKVCELALEKTGVGWGVFNVVNDSLTGNEETEVVLKREFPDVKVTKELGKWEAPISNRKVKEVFGWEEGFSLKGEVEKVGRGGDIGDR